MALTLLTYFVIAFGVLFMLAVMITRIGTSMTECPNAVPALKAAVTSITTAFVAIGIGGVFLAALIVPIFGQFWQFGLLTGLGVASLCLGLGFTQAIANLKAVATPAP